jgi:hypothetical protein
MPGSPSGWSATLPEIYVASGAGISAVLPAAADPPAPARSRDSRWRGRRKPWSSEDFRERPRVSTWSFVSWILPHHMNASLLGRSQVAGLTFGGASWGRSGDRLNKRNRLPDPWKLYADCRAELAPVQIATAISYTEFSRSNTGLTRSVEAPRIPSVPVSSGQEDGRRRLFLWICFNPTKHIVLRLMKKYFKIPGCLHIVFQAIVA